MAERRMFAKTIIDSDAFLDMPLSTQSLYFHLSMRADDDGFINNPKKIQRMIGASDDDLKLLVAKNFIIPFESGIVVIKHWKIHNYIQSDRYKQTVYQEEKALLEVKKNKAYTIGIPDENQMDTKCIQAGYSLETQVRLGKDSIGKDSIGQDIIVVESDDSPQPAPKKKPVKHKYGEFQNVLLTDNEYENLANSFGIELRDKAIKLLDEYIEEKGYKSKSHNLAIRRWVIDAVKEKSKKQGRQEPVPAWMKKNGFNDFAQKKNDAALEEMEGLFLQEVNTINNDPKLAERAAKLQEELKGR